MNITPLFLTTMADIISPFIYTLGIEVMRIYHGGFTVHTKSDNSPFTIADTLTEQKIIAFLHHHTPHIPIYAEESFTTFPRDMPPTFWLVDPIDGTKGFINRNNIFTINIGLIHHQKPVFGVIYAPQTQDSFIGFALNDSTITNPDTSTKNPIPETIKNSFTQDLCTRLSTKLYTDISPDVSTSLSPSLSTDLYTDLYTDISTPLWAAYKNNQRIQCGPLADRLTIASNANMSLPPINAFIKHHHIKQVLALTSSIKICKVATGEADIYPRWGRCYEWDTAAGDAILRGAGGTICDMQGTPLLYAKPNLLNTAFICIGGRTP